MTDDPKQRQDDPVTPQEDRLAKELESLYRRVASADSAAAASDMAGNPDLYYKILQIRPGVSISDIRLAYEKMTSTWDPERYPHVSSWKETSTQKLKEIKTAYEKLLLLHAERETSDGNDAKEQPLSTALLPFPVNTDTEETAPSRATVDMFSGSAFKLHPWMIAPGLLIVVILPLLFFLWPTLYHYESIRLGGKDYPIRINRLTTHAQYYDGRQWLEPPFPAETGRHVPAGMSSPPASVEPGRIGSPGEPKPASPPPIKSIAPQAAPAPVPAQPARAEVRSESKSAQPSRTKGISPQAALSPLPTEPAGVRSRNESRPALPAPTKRKIASPDQFGVKTKAGTPYSIQISAYPERHKADALADKMRASGFAVRVDAVSIQGKGQWYRVLLGQFEDRGAALRYLKDHRIGETYPGSFVQRAS
ncbi:MAG: SPOR domain-containing protein, partial [Candidatus Babeliales bacterium]